MRVPFPPGREWYKGPKGYHYEVFDCISVHGRVKAVAAHTKKDDKFLVSFASPTEDALKNNLSQSHINSKVRVAFR